MRIRLRIHRLAVDIYTTIWQYDVCVISTVTRYPLAEGIYWQRQIRVPQMKPHRSRARFSISLSVQLLKLGTMGHIVLVLVCLMRVFVR